MKQLKLMILMLCCLMFSHQAAWADNDPNTIVFQETFDQTNGSGGRDGKYSGSIASSAIKYDNEGWADAVKCGGAFQCVKYGTGSDNGVLTTPAISLGGATHALLTFSAAGWGDTKKNTLAITANDGITLSGDINIEELENEEWTDYTVLITVTSGSSLQLTFSGRRGFLDDIVVRTITAVPAPSLPDSYTFFPNTDEANAGENIMLTPVSYTTAYFTTDGSTPSNTNGTEALLTTNIPIHGTTTVKAIAYVGDMASEVVSRTYTQGTTVEGIAAFKALADGAEVRLFLPDNANARVLHAQDGKQMYLRDNSGALCFDFGTTATFNPAPVHNMHVAGWIVGKKQTDSGLLKFVATENTNTDFLALAAPVTEAPTQPTSVTRGEEGVFDFTKNTGDWVLASDVRLGTDLGIENPFNTEQVASKFDFQQLVDVSGIILNSVSGETTVAPVYYGNIKPVVYVVDEDNDFVSPSSDVANATIRLKRTLSKDYWNTFVVPFDMPSFDGEIRAYDGLDGKAMHFGKASQIEAGIPYLVKPHADIVNPVYSNVTLSARQATFINHGGDYYFVGTYRPVELATDKSELFLTPHGLLGYPYDDASRHLKGTSAYFQILNGGEAMTLTIDDDGGSGVVEVKGMTEAERNDIYNLNGQRVTQPRKGLYIVNGKKLIIH